VDTPALLPDGTASPRSISRVLAARGSIRSAPAEADAIEHVQRQMGLEPPEDKGAPVSGAQPHVEEEK
jgi:NADH-quinone oxidoreductase subunit J